ncbi:hypothetical protein LEP1GSC058_2757 [Leptospira fainei serovar Hurstbridge str. BUT 6]|uniref:Uncharacterized protein n=1 Tax=Leptospira fainei serovar Hurstbridge str. BUT 6 TaxID=1193011 RepID=S3UVG5_9LEPT|nr:hypothetical protein LEP1GSC058_2757 [Leptospira fainei serovar Hurstbridge str. BUT 6]
MRIVFKGVKKFESFDSKGRMFLIASSKAFKEANGTLATFSAVSIFGKLDSDSEIARSSVLTAS